jgi:uncharacterized protein (DUF1330 family)
VAHQFDTLYSSTVLVANALVPDPATAASFFSAPEEGPFVMVNLLRFREHAAYPDGRDGHLTGREAYDRYAVGVRELIDRLGGRIVYAGAVTGLLLGQVEDLWDAVGLVEYPSLPAFLGMIRSPAMREIEPHRTAGLAGQLNIRTRPQQ